MTGKISKDDLKVVGSPYWQVTTSFVGLKKQYLTGARQFKRVVESGSAAQEEDSQSASDDIWEVKVALMIMAGIVIDMRDALQAANQGQCCPPLDMTASSGGEELPKLKGGRCSDLITDQEDFANLDVCRGLEVLRDWLLNINETLT